MRIVVIYNKAMKFSSTAPSTHSSWPELQAPPHPVGRDISPSGPARISSQTLFLGAQVIEIEHKGSIYRLRQTALGKLILTK